MTKEYCRVSIDERDYQNWLCKDENLDELWLKEMENQYDDSRSDCDD